MSDTQSTHDYVLHHGVVTQGNITTSQEAEISIQEVGFTLSGHCCEKTCLRGFPLDRTKASLLNYRD